MNNQSCRGASAARAGHFCRSIGNTHVKRVISVLLIAFVVSNVTRAEETAFSRVKVADAKGKQADARLIFSDNNKNVVVRVADRDFVTVPYDQIDKFSYEYTKKHRITQGAVVMGASLGAGAIVMLTTSKNPWLYTNLHEQNVPKNVVLRMDKKKYKNIFDAIETHPSKEVEFLGDAGKAKKQGQRETTEMVEECG